MKKGWLLLFTLIPFFAHSQLKINEIMSNNVSAVMDDSYNYSMWLELYNSGPGSVNQNQFYLTDDLSEPEKWRPKSKNIPAKGYSVLWFEREEIAGHATFKLDPEGGSIYLIDRSGEIVDRLSYPEQYRNVSYGRIADGENSWVYFQEYSNGESNNGKAFASKPCANPEFEREGGFYSGSLAVRLLSSGNGETIYYTKNGEEPSEKSIKYTPGSVITLSETTCLRARSFAVGRLPSEISTTTYFINERKFNLPVISLVTEQRNLTDNAIGMYVKGTNGIVGACPDNVVANYNQDWDRPVNFEFFDDKGISQINQEVDAKVAGGCSRGHPQKSLKITARKKFGNNQLRYDFFPTAKPYRKFDGLLYRNSGNDFNYSMLRDGFMQTLIHGRMDVDGQAYLPTVCFINGDYYGIQNLRETSNHRTIYSNYGLEKEEIYLIDNTEIGTDPEFQRMVSFARDNDINDSSIYAQVCEMMDIDSYLSYMIAEIYFNNGDWPHHNIKMWKKRENGKWRPILFDTDFGYGLFGIPSNNSSTGNAILYALSETPKRENGYENIYMLRRLMQNDLFKKKFINRFCIHVSSTFDTGRANQILDSLRLRIEDEIVYHKQRYGGGSSFSSQISAMKKFSADRPGTILGYIRDYFGLGPVQTIEISSNLPEASYRLFDEDIIDNRITLKHFKGQVLEITANPVKGYEFKQWETDSDIFSNAIYSTVLDENSSVRVVYEKSSEPVGPDEPSTVFINKIVASNTVHKDEYGEKDDYIEIYNGGDVPVDIAGWYISDTPVMPALYEFPCSEPDKTTIPPKGRVLVWADSQPEQGVLHANFSLNKSGEYVALSRRDEYGKIRTIDLVSFPALPKNMSYSRSSDGEDNWVIQEMTFDKPNKIDTAIETIDSPVHVKIYPILVEDDFIVENGAPGDFVRLFDLTGNLLLQKEITSDREVVNLPLLPHGMYIVHIGNRSFKILKR